MRVLVLNGPNLNLLGQREPDVYGYGTLDGIMADLQAEGTRLGVELTFFQSNHEGELVDRVQAAMGQFDGLLVNPGGLTHYSVSLLDALLASGLPTVEVHLTNPARREAFRSVSVVARGVTGRVEGFGAQGYLLALHGLAHILHHGGIGGESAGTVSGQGR